RTARAGRQGVAWSFVTPEEGQRLTDVEKLTGVLIEKMAYPDFKPGPVPSDIRAEREKAEQREQRRVAETRTVAPQELSEEEKRKLFPSGIVPSSGARSGLTRKRSRRRR
ncbi:MAG: hypothetical protein MI741_03740, partial [Rhodospirillales bacterium]|nr:hypothetical protein [Rhodospirillales bacterium]